MKQTIRNYNGNDNDDKNNSYRYITEYIVCTEHNKNIKKQAYVNMHAMFLFIIKFQQRPVF